MSDTRTRLLGWWQRARSALTPPSLPGNRHDPDVAIWSVANFVEVVPGSGGRRWKPGVEHTQLLPVIRPDAPTEIQTLHRRYSDCVVVSGYSVERSTEVGSPEGESSRGGLVAREGPRVFHQFLRAAPDATRRCTAVFGGAGCALAGGLGRYPSCPEDSTGLGCRTGPRCTDRTANTRCYVSRGTVRDPGWPR